MKKNYFFASLKSLKKGVGSSSKCHGSPTLFFLIQGWFALPDQDPFSFGLFDPDLVLKNWSNYEIRKVETSLKMISLTFSLLMAFFTKVQNCQKRYNKWTNKKISHFCKMRHYELWNSGSWWRLIQWIRIGNPGTNWSWFKKGVSMASF
jgi:hypothetical protein